MCDAPQAIHQRQVRARKPHRCCECTRLMPVGEVHQVISGIWDGHPDRFRTCLSCARIRGWLVDEIRAGRVYGDAECGVELGGLERACEVAYHDWLAEQGRSKAA